MRCNNCRRGLHSAVFNNDSDVRTVDCLCDSAISPYTSNYSSTYDLNCACHNTGCSNCSGCGCSTGNFEVKTAVYVLEAVFFVCIEGCSCLGRSSDSC